MPRPRVGARPHRGRGGGKEAGAVSAGPLLLRLALGLAIVLAIAGCGTRVNLQGGERHLDWEIGFPF